MDLSSLPNGLLFKVLKRSKYTTISRLRRMDSSIDSMAKKYDLGVILPVRVFTQLKSFENDPAIYCHISLIINGHVSQFHRWTRPLHPTDESFQSHSVRFNIDITNSFRECEDLLNRIKVTSLTLLATYLPLSDHFITSLYNQRSFLRDIRYLQIWPEQYSLTCSKESMQQLIDNCPKLHQLIVHFGGDATSPMGIISNEKVLGGRKWKVLHLNEALSLFSQIEDYFVAEMNTDFLANVVKNCENFTYEGHPPQFDVMELVDFIEDCVDENEFFNDQKWNFGTIDSGNSSAEDVINRLKTINKIKFETSTGQLRMVSKIKLRDNERVAIEFDMYV